MCFDTAASEIVNPAARAVTLASPRATCSKIARLVGSARAKNTRFSGLARYSTIWLNVSERPSVRQGQHVATKHAARRQSLPSRQTVALLSDGSVRHNLVISETVAQRTW